jgi:hypothetical protein
MQKAAGSSYSLRAISRKIQEEREAVIRRRLEGVARFREGKVPAKYFAASIEDHELFNYTPVYAWETRPIYSSTTRWLLEGAGIDPETVATEGEARQIMRAVGRRRYRGLCEIRDLAPLIEAGVDQRELWKLTKKEYATRTKMAARY